MDDEFEDENGETLTVRDVIGHEFIEPGENDDILDGGCCETFDMPRASTVVEVCNMIGDELTKKLATT